MKTFTSDWSSVDECVEWINTHRNPNAAVAEVVKYNLDIDEGGFAVDVLMHYTGTPTFNFRPEGGPK